MSSLEIGFAAFSIGLMLWTARTMDLQGFSSGFVDQALLFLCGANVITYLWLAFPRQGWFLGNNVGLLVALGFLGGAFIGLGKEERLHLPAIAGGLGITLAVIHFLVKYAS